MVDSAEPMTSTRTLSRRAGSAVGGLFTGAPSDFDDKVAQVVHDADVRRQEKGGGIHLFDDGRPGNPVANVKAGTVVDGARDVVALFGQEDVPETGDRVLELPPFDGRTAQIGAGNGSNGLDA